MIFLACILRHDLDVSLSSGTKRLNTWRLKLWIESKITELVQDITNIVRRGSGGGQREEDDNSIARTYHSMVIDGRLRAGVRWLKNRDDKCILNPEDADIKTGRPAINMLREKHPDILFPDFTDKDWASFEVYDE